jgi:hypothetical protein
VALNPEPLNLKEHMKIVVIGGSGLIGSKLVNILRQRGHQVLAASPASGVNSITGEGLAEALAGARVVVDVANSPSFEDKAVLAFFQTSGHNLLAAEAAAGVLHHVALSVVGTDRLAESGYFRGKIAQEKLIKAGKIPYTIVHSTQFMEFLGGIAQSGSEGQTVRLSPAFVQPIASDDVAAAMADFTLGAPSTAPSKSPAPNACAWPNSCSATLPRPRTRALSLPTCTRATSALNSRTTPWCRATSRVWARYGLRNGSPSPRPRNKRALGELLLPPLGKGQENCRAPVSQTASVNRHKGRCISIPGCPSTQMKSPS